MFVPSLASRALHCNAHYFSYTQKRPFESASASLVLYRKEMPSFELYRLRKDCPELPALCPGYIQETWGIALG